MQVFSRFLCRCFALLLAVGFAALVSSSAARAQVITSREGIALENQILELRQQVQQLQQSQGGNGASVLAPSQPGGSGVGGSAALLPSLVLQVQQLQQDVHSLRGQLDTLEHQVTTQNDQINQEIGDLKFEMAQQGTKPSTGLTSPAGTQNTNSRTLGQLPVASTTPPAPAPSRRHVVASLVAARQALAAHDYTAAEADARAIIAKRGKGVYHGEAELVLAQALDGQGRFQESALAYDDAYSADKTGPYAAKALLGLSSSLAAIGQDNAACDTLDSLASQFSSLSPSLEAQVKTVRLKAHCH